MGVLDFLNRNKVKHILQSETYKADRVGHIDVPDKLTDLNAFELASSVSEIYFPIDFIADRISKLRFYVADKNGKELQSSELNRFVSNGINPLYSFSDLVYQYIFSYLADGNVRSYQGVPSSYKKASVNNIARIDILRPNDATFDEYLNISPLFISKLTDAIRKAYLTDYVKESRYLDIDRLVIDCIDSNKRLCSNVFSKSPLFKSYRPINNLLATYSARYNVYVNNGAAGYLVKKAEPSNGTGVAAAMNDPKTRKDILEDINDRNGLTGRRNLWGISSVPVEWINTLASIKDLMPFEETFADACAIAGVYQIPSQLIPRKDNPTFDNAKEGEKSVWENPLMSIADTFAENWGKITMINQTGNKIVADYETVSSLKANESDKEDIITKKLTNLKTLLEVYPEKKTEINAQIEIILSSYGKR